MYVPRPLPPLTVCTTARRQPSSRAPSRPGRIKRANKPSRAHGQCPALRRRLGPAARPLVLLARVRAVTLPQVDRPRAWARRRRRLAWRPVRLCRLLSRQRTPRSAAREHVQCNSMMCGPPIRTLVFDGVDAAAWDRAVQQGSRVYAGREVRGRSAHPPPTDRSTASSPKTATRTSPTASATRCPAGTLPAPASTGSSSPEAAPQGTADRPRPERRLSVSQFCATFVPPAVFWAVLLFLLFSWGGCDHQ